MQFKIIPGHHGGIVSQMGEWAVCVCGGVTLGDADAELCLAVVDRGGRFLVSASGNRGWHGDATRTVFVHDIKAVV